MKFSKLSASQLGHPTGFFARVAGGIWNRRNAELNERVMELLKPQPNDHVLDVGFGGGYLLDRMSVVVTEGRLEGVDVSAAIVRQAEKRFRNKASAGKIKFTCAAVESLPYPDGHFTKVCSVNSIFYWQDAEIGLKEIYRVLDRAGQAALCFTCKNSIESKTFAKHIHLYDSEEVVQQLAEIGFKNVQAQTFTDQYRQFVCIMARKP
jgi:ubiquinone/menaquinone biosynthesis C-methylase UbiE